MRSFLITNKSLCIDSSSETLEETFNNHFVSYEFRHCGIGKRLFMNCVDLAKKWGAKKLYISGHSAEETQKFYKKIGCIEAEEINITIAEHEPFDCQLEYVL